MWLRYHVEAVLNEIILPGPAGSIRQDGLWQSTCFEIFARRPDAAEYIELNFSPSSNWAAYHFDDYRLGMDEQAVATTPEIYLDASESHVALEAELVLPQPWGTVEIEIALSAIIEETDGAKSYWALAHPPGAPDFHHPDCFAFMLPAASAA